jgi:hypothetical protein
MTRPRSSGTLGAPARDFKISKPMIFDATRNLTERGAIRHQVGANYPEQFGEDP